AASGLRQRGACRDRQRRRRSEKQQRADEESRQGHETASPTIAGTTSSRLRASRSRLSQAVTRGTASGQRSPRSPNTSRRPRRRAAALAGSDETAQAIAVVSASGSSTANERYE